MATCSGASWAAFSTPLPRRAPRGTAASPSLGPRARSSCIPCPRVRVWQCPTNGSARDQRQVRAQSVEPLGLGLGNSCADFDRVHRAVDGCNLGHPRDVDHHGGREQSHAQHRDEALAAGEHTGIVAVRRENLDGFVHRSGADVVEPGGLHRRRPAAGSSLVSVSAALMLLSACWRFRLVRAMVGRLASSTQ